MNGMRNLGLLGISILLVTLAACNAAEPVAPTSTATLPAPTATPTPLAPTATPTPPPPASTPAGPPALPPEPQRIEFQAADGQALEGLYYPAAVNPAPIVVLMHWAGGDQRDWDAIAPWLQNRGLPYTTPAGAPPWLDPSWFPAMPEGRSYAVFTFTFRGCAGGCNNFDRSGWLLDAQAAIATARGLEGVDPARVSALGASIGADGAADGCAEGCVGTLSLSPGNYLGVPYVDAVATIETGWSAAPPIMDSFVYPLQCLAAEEDGESAPTCRSAAGEHYQTTIYPGGLHGMMLIQPDLEPNPLEIVLNWLLLEE